MGWGKRVRRGGGGGVKKIGYRPYRTRKHDWLHRAIGIDSRKRSCRRCDPDDQHVRNRTFIGQPVLSFINSPFDSREGREPRQILAIRFIEEGCCRPAFSESP